VNVRGRRTGFDFLNLGDGVDVLLATVQEGASGGCDFRSGETSVWMFCGQGNDVKDFMVISWSYT
jgi:hypothetical protein